MTSEHRAFEKSLAPRRFKRFQISEISAVDKPAQEGARVAIMKREEQSQMAKEDYSWMRPAAPAASGSEDSNIAHEHIKRIADEFYRLRAKPLRVKRGLLK